MALPDFPELPVLFEIPEEIPFAIPRLLPTGGGAPREQWLLQSSGLQSSGLQSFGLGAAPKQQQQQIEPWGVGGGGLGVLREAGLAPAPTFAMGAAVGVVAFLLLLRRCGARLRRKATVRTAVEMGRLARPHSANASPRGLTFTQ